MNYEKKEVLSIWVGTLELISYDVFKKEWMEEKYSQQATGLDGFSKFMKTYKTGWYNHDFQDIRFVTEPIPIENFIKDCSYYESYSSLVLAAAKERGISTCNTIIIIFDFEYPRSKAKKLDDLPLKYLGSFPYTVTFSKEVMDILNSKDNKA